MEISNEMRVAIYHVYHTAQVAGKPYIGYSEFSEEQQNKTLIGNIKYLDKEGAHVVHADVHGNPWNEITFYNYGECQLLLTPLSEITDEHAVEVARIMNIIDAECPQSDYPHWIEYTKRTYLTDLKMSKYAFSVHAIDYLRSKSYHVPYMGIDLFEAGFAVEIKSEGGGDE